MSTSNALYAPLPQEDGLEPHLPVQPSASPVSARIVAGALMVTVGIGAFSSGAVGAAFDGIIGYQQLEYNEDAHEECTCDLGYEPVGEPPNDVCEEIDPCASGENICFTDTGSCEDLDPPLEYDGYKCNCDDGYEHPTDVEVHPEHSCVPVPCGEVSILNSNTHEKTAMPKSDHTVLCEAGYGKNGETGEDDFVIECKGVDYGHSAWQNVETCDPVECPLLTIPGSEMDNTATGARTYETVSVTCIDGYEFPCGSCYRDVYCAPFISGLSMWTFFDEEDLGECVPMICEIPELVNVNQIVGQYFTDDDITVQCSDGYHDNDMYQFTASCVGSGCGNTWDGYLGNCEPKPCPPLVVANSDAHAALDTGAHVEDPHRLLTCADGFFPSVDAGSCQVDRVCAATGPGTSGWLDGGATCERVVCDAFTVDNAEVVTTFAQDGLQFASINCDAGYMLADQAGISAEAFCAPLAPCEASWSGIKECVPVPCPDLTVPFSQAYELDTGADVESDTILVTCAAGFQPSNDAGECQVSRDCVPASPGLSEWSGDATCDPVVCTPFTGDNFGAFSNTLDGATGEQTQSVTCTNGYAANGAAGFVATCDPTVPCDRTWNNIEACECVECFPLQVAHSNYEEAVDGYCTTDQPLVDCNDGYCSDDGDKFSVTCTGIAPAEVEWMNELSCEPVSCVPFYLANSNYATVPFTGVTGDWTVVQCDDGYHSNDCTSWIMTCEAEGPCASTWDHPTMQCLPDVELD
jgi:hypothetical protein